MRASILKGVTLSGRRIYLHIKAAVRKCRVQTFPRKEDVSLRTQEQGRMEWRWDLWRVL
jgi:hypothetical protein